jgi:hypothetical protein
MTDSDSAVQTDPQNNGSKTAAPRDAAFWAQRLSTLEITNLPPELIGLNVEGRHTVGPLQGFGQMWLKTYRIRLSGADVTPAEVVTTWKENFGKFWPPGNRFYAPLTGIAPGEVALLNLPVPGGLRLSTGVAVLFADEESFAFMTPEGHMFAAIITFSAYEDENGTVAQVQPLIRANDPLWEIVMRVYGFRKEDAFWLQTLESLAAHFGVKGTATLEAVKVDPRLRWSQAKNIWHNAAIRSTLYTMTTPFRWVRNSVKRRKLQERQP